MKKIVLEVIYQGKHAFFSSYTAPYWVSDPKEAIQYDLPKEARAVAMSDDMSDILIECEIETVFLSEVK